MRKSTLDIETLPNRIRVLNGCIEYFARVSGRFDDMDRVLVTEIARLEGERVRLSTDRDRAPGELSRLRGELREAKALASDSNLADKVAKMLRLERQLEKAQAEIAILDKHHA